MDYEKKIAIENGTTEAILALGESVIIFAIGSAVEHAMDNFLENNKDTIIEAIVEKG